VVSGGGAAVVGADVAGADVRADVVSGADASVVSVGAGSLAVGAEVDVDGAVVGPVEAVVVVAVVVVDAAPVVVVVLDAGEPPPLMSAIAATAAITTRATAPATMTPTRRRFGRGRTMSPLGGGTTGIGMARGGLSGAG